MFSRGPRANRRREEPMGKAKPFDIPKREVWEAFKRVKADPLSGMYYLKGTTRMAARMLAATPVVVKPIRPACASPDDQHPETQLAVGRPGADPISLRKRVPLSALKLP